MVVVSVSTPIWESVYFLKASFGGGSSEFTTFRDVLQKGALADLEPFALVGSGLIKLGQWGYCVADACSQSKLG